MKIVLLGAPGSGKGTQAVNISQKYSVPHISTGDIFRDNINRETPLGIKVKSIMDSGNLCPDEVTIELVKDRLSKEDCKNGYLLDGFPRNLVQAQALETIASPDIVVDIDVDFSKIEDRITGRRSCSVCGGSYHTSVIGHTEFCPVCGGTLIRRKDDNPETVKERLSVYSEQTEPLISYYKSYGKLKTVDGNLSVEKVFEEIVKVLDNDNGKN